MIEWKTPEAREIAASVGVKDPEQAVRIHARRLLDELSLKSVPLAIAPLLQWANVRKVRTQAMPLDGALRRLPNGGFDILVREDRSRSRQHFSTAHELGHVLFHRFAPKAKAKQQELRQNAPEEEERLCNVAAAEFLMPEWYLDRVLTNQSPADAVLSIAQSCEVSAQAALIRIAPRVRKNGVLELWQQDSGTWTRVLRRRFGGAPKAIDQFEVEGWPEGFVGQHRTWEGATSLYAPNLRQQCSARSFVQAMQARTVIVAHVVQAASSALSQIERICIDRVRRAHATHPQRDCKLCEGEGVIHGDSGYDARRRRDPPRLCPCRFGAVQVAV